MVIALLKAALIVGAAGAIAWAINKIIKKIEGLSDLAKRASDYVSELPDRVANATGEAVDTLKTQSKQTSRERAGENVGSYLDVKAKREAEEARRKRSETVAKKPINERIETLKKYIASVKANGDLGVLDNGVYLPLDALEKELASLGGA